MRLNPAEWIGREVDLEIDRPAGSRHPDYPQLVYPINYGLVPGTLAADGEPIDAYLLGSDKPLLSAHGRVIAVTLREDDIEDKLVVAIGEDDYSAEEIRAAVEFQERYFTSQILDA